MKIGQIVKQHIKQIFFHCDNVEHNEISSLLDSKYSKKTFGINFPFCIELENIEQSQSKRYWTEIYLVRSKRVRVTSQWFETDNPLFIKYLESKGIELLKYERDENPINPQLPSNRANSRYRGNPIGNAQNLFIRNILSSLGIESFSEKNWNSSKDYFSHKCAYCGALTELLMEHAIPINKEKLGEHRLGNLVPSCKQCNSNKGGKDFRAFLEADTVAISKIEEYMDSRNYVPLEDNEQIKKILNMAHKEVAALADRYITIINELFPQNLTFSAAEEADMLATQNCPICATELPLNPRYPRCVCQDCAAKARSADSRPLAFFNETLSGGFLANYADTGENYTGRECYIDGVKCWADEAKMGGIVIEASEVV